MMESDVKTNIIPSVKVYQVILISSNVATIDYVTLFGCARW